MSNKFQSSSNGMGPSLREFLLGLIQRSQPSHKLPCVDKKSVEKIGKEVEKVLKLCSQKLEN